LKKKKQALRYDTGKEPLSLIPVYPILELAKVYQFGSGKYSPNNWRKGMPWSKVYSAMMRHALKFWGGEDLDNESKLHHLAHVIWNGVALLEYTRTQKKYDDRPV
jgi:hypothetical protein